MEGEVSGNNILWIDNFRKCFVVFIVKLLCRDMSVSALVAPSPGVWKLGSTRCLSTPPWQGCTILWGERAQFLGRLDLTCTSWLLQTENCNENFRMLAVHIITHIKLIKWLFEIHNSGQWCWISAFHPCKAGKVLENELFWHHTLEVSKSQHWVFGSTQNSTNNQ